MKTHDTILNAKKHCQEKENEELNIRSHLWKPGPPDYQEITLTPRVPLIPSGPFDPLISIDFGGLDGGKLNLLTGLTVYMISNRSPIVGLGFIYGDGTLVFGLQSSVGISLMIDGPGGERIASIGVVTDDAETTILGLQVGFPETLQNLETHNTDTVRPLRSQLIEAVLWISHHYAKIHMAGEK